MSSEVESLRDDKTRAFEVRKFCSIHAGADEHLIEFWEFGEADAPLVSIIIPLYNCERYLAETLDSIVSQSLSSWEAILVDDCSSDGSLEIALQFSERDHRFVVLRNDCNRGAAFSRNRALAAACGRFIAYLDSDDYWKKEKLERQITFMTENRFGACMTSYETVNEDGSFRNIVHIDERLDYKKFLKKPPTCSHTIMFDTELVDKKALVMPDIRKRQDAATWLQVITLYGCLHGFDEVLAANRKRSDSLSANKVSAVKGTWFLYTEIEGLSKPYAGYCLFWQMFHAVLKRIGKR